MSEHSPKDQGTLLFNCLVSMSWWHKAVENTDLCLCVWTCERFSIQREACVQIYRRISLGLAQGNREVGIKVLQGVLQLSTRIENQIGSYWNKIVFVRYLLLILPSIKFSIKQRVFPVGFPRKTSVFIFCILSYKLGSDLFIQADQNFCGISTHMIVAFLSFYFINLIQVTWHTFNVLCTPSCRVHLTSLRANGKNQISQTNKETHFHKSNPLNWWDEWIHI